VETQEANRFVMITFKHIEAHRKKEDDFIAYMESHNKSYEILEAKIYSLQEKVSSILVEMKLT
jgi:hypothetical protein